ncbi:MAG TPA: thioredoxin fold domain-containing protein [Mucilaginibacter sp.]|nr:thioredoxin fold domain-containing protein [Mucilaginibacter sp.]
MKFYSAYSLVLLVCMLFSGPLKAQDDHGIQFQHGQSWEQIRSKAKEEGKYIFIDGFTTWCVPCKEMEQHIFTQPKVAEFFNKNFINVSVQFDITKNDNAEIKNWYATAKELGDEYKVNSYPTFLFFNPDGELVHKVVGGFSDPNDFIKQARIALDPHMQYLVLKQKYLNGEQDTSTMFALLNSGHLANDNLFLNSVINKYLRTQKDLLTAKNIGYILAATQHTDDPGFKILLDHPAAVDSATGKGKSFERVMRILFDDVVLPYVRINGEKKVYGGGMVVYEGKVNDHVDWQKVKAVLDTGYDSRADAELLYARCTYYYWTKNWSAYEQHVNSFIGRYDQWVDDDLLNMFANTVLAGCDDKACINSAVKWSEKTLDGPLNPGYIYVYSNLLYKSGRKQDAIDFLERKTSSPDEKAKYPFLNTLLANIKAGKQTW